MPVLPCKIDADLDDNNRSCNYRAVAERAHGPLPPDVHVHHVCENKACCEMSHLRPLDADTHLRWHGSGLGLSYTERRAVAMQARYARLPAMVAAAYAAVQEDAPLQPDPPTVKPRRRFGRLRHTWQDKLRERSLERCTSYTLAPGETLEEHWEAQHS